MIKCIAYLQAGRRSHRGLVVVSAGPHSTRHSLSFSMLTCTVSVYRTNIQNNLYGSPTLRSIIIHPLEYQDNRRVHWVVGHHLVTLTS
jgi:hypothetical protein